MDTTPAVESAPTGSTPSSAATSSTPEVVEQDLLVEDVSIDGMCGVY